jgi:hypothetical protein
LPRTWGVSRRLVGYAIEELEDSDVNLGKRSELTTDEKREQVREFIEDTPDTPGPSGTVFFTGCSRR